MKIDKIVDQDFEFFCSKY